MEKVAIALATYNGASFLEEQVASILKQTFVNWTLFIRDDNSKDSTQQIIDILVKKYPDKIILVEDNLQASSSASNFFSILTYIKKSSQKYDYYMFCDQDDYWHANKIETMMNFAQQYDSNRPLLLYSDLNVVNQQLEIIGDSFIRYRALNPEAKSINQLLIQNNITGCTMFWNQILFLYILPEIDIKKIAMHDWWVTLVAATFGEIHFIEDSLIDYRQHDKNVVGATNVNSIRFVINRLVKSNRVKKTLEMSQIQAEVFYEQYVDKMNEKQKEIFQAFIQLKNKNKYGRLKTVIKYKFLKQGVIQIIGELLFI